MRKIIIDTDTATDDAAALLIACAQPDTEILAVTTVAGNIPLEKGTRNALQTLETAGKKIPVYPGASRPLQRPLVCAEGVHGKDGLGDRDLVHPAALPEKTHGVTKILELVRAYPGEIEIVALGPATNIALAILQDREAMAGVRHIWSMGTGGFGPGNCTPVAEFNVYVDAEAYQILLTAGIPLTIAGFDLCLGDAALNRTDLDTLASGGPVMQFMTKAASALVAYNERSGHGTFVDLPDAVAMGCALWPEMVLETVSVYAYCCTKEEP
ncbi:MAG: nucleoside hydrolase, partial [Clostridia bacterium]|nr:nucleoside hydrolase [Clostridia bacterium]